MGTLECSEGAHFVRRGINRRCGYAV